MKVELVRQTFGINCDYIIVDNTIWFIKIAGKFEPVAPVYFYYYSCDEIVTNGMKRKMLEKRVLTKDEIEQLIPGGMAKLKAHMTKQFVDNL